MKLSYRLIIILFFVVGCLFYLIGNLFPIGFLKPNIKSEQINTSQYYQIAIGVISAVVTLLAVVIALFKEDIRKKWEFSKIEVNMPSETFFEIFNTSIGSSAAGQTLEAIKYNGKIEIFNSGSISATGLEIYLESLSFTGQGYPNTQTIVSESHKVSIDGRNESDINLSPESRKTVSVIDLTSPSQQSSPEGSSNDIPAKLNIAGVDSNPDFKNGKWIGKFAIYSTNTKPVRFTLHVEWNGQWQKRASEMKHNLKIDLIAKA